MRHKGIGELSFGIPPILYLGYEGWGSKVNHCAGIGRQEQKPWKNPTLRTHFPVVAAFESNEFLLLKQAVVTICEGLAIRRIARHVSRNEIRGIDAPSSESRPGDFFVGCFVGFCRAAVLTRISIMGDGTNRSYLVRYP